MSTRHRQPLLRQVISTFALAATLGFVMLGLSQCRGIDSPMGVAVRSNQPFSNGISDCVQRCNDQYKQCQNQENVRHRQAVLQCNQLPTAQKRQACLAAEETFREQQMNACVAAMNACKARCQYREGSGGGGR